jgi:hypothetical protein
MKVFYFPKGTKTVYVNVLSSNSSLAVYNITEAEEKEILLDDELVCDISANRCRQCSQNARSKASDSIKTHLTKKLTNDEVFFNRTLRSITGHSYSRRTYLLNRSKEDQIKAMLGWMDLTPYYKEYYRKLPNACPGLSNSYLLGVEEEQRLKDGQPCRAGETFSAAVNLKVPNLLWQSNMDLRRIDAEEVGCGYFKVFALRHVLDKVKTLNGQEVKTVNAIGVPYLLGNVYGDGDICWGEQGRPYDPRGAYATYFSSAFNYDLVPHEYNDSYSPYDSETREYEDEDDEEGTPSVVYNPSDDDRYPKVEHYYRFTSNESFLDHLEKDFTLYDGAYDSYYADNDVIGLLMCQSPSLPVTVSLRSEMTLKFRPYPVYDSSIRLSYTNYVSFSLAFVYKVNNSTGKALVRFLAGGKLSDLKVIDLNKLKAEVKPCSLQERLQKKLEAAEVPTVDSGVSDKWSSRERQHFILEQALMYCQLIQEETGLETNEINSVCGLGYFTMAELKQLMKERQQQDQQEQLATF